MKNALIDFIKTHSDWKDELTEKPYCLAIKEDGPYTIFNYSQIDSDFHNEIVRVARGIILRITEVESEHVLVNGGVTTDIKVVCQAYNKFGNYGESYADSIDWSTAKVQEKVDGSIIKVWHNDDLWHISTNGMIDAFKTDLQLPTEEFKSFGDLFKKAVENTCGSYSDLLDRLDQDYTYIFELVSPFNRVVVPYKDTKVYLTGIRNMVDGLEYDPRSLGWKDIPCPEIYSFSTFEDILENIKTLPFSKEGYVVVDAEWKRVKVKSLAYVAAHHLKNNGIVSRERAFDLIKSGEQEEFLGYFPEYISIFEEISRTYNNTKTLIEEALGLAREWKDNTTSKKEFALKVLELNPKIRKFLFTFYDRGTVDFDISFKDLI